MIAQYLAGVAGQIALIEQFAAALRNNDGAAVRAISQRLQQARPGVQAIAHGYGFKVCGTGP